MIRVFLDANVIFTAAHNPEGNGSALFRLAAERGYDVISSQYAIDEASRNIAVKYPECMAELAGLVASLTPVAEPSADAISRALAYNVPQKHLPILAAAIASEANVLVTGDRRHFGPLYGKIVEGVRVLMPADAVSWAMSRRPAELRRE